MDDSLGLFGYVCTHVSWTDAVRGLTSVDYVILAYLGFFAAAIIGSRPTHEPTAAGWLERRYVVGTDPYRGVVLVVTETVSARRPRAAAARAWRLPALTLALIAAILWRMVACHFSA